MHKLFALSQLRTIQRLGVPQFTPELYDQIIKNNNLVVRGQSLLYRLPREELKHVINIQCPINSLEQKYAEVIIKASKELRKHGGVNQNRICGGCQFLSTCPQARKEVEGKQVDDGLKNLMVLFYGLQNLAKPEAVFFRQWVSGYRLGDSIISAINDLAKGGVEIDEYDKCRIEGIKVAEERQAKKKSQEGATGDQAKMQEMLKTVQKVRKPENKPRGKPTPQIKEAQEGQQALGKNGQEFSFQKEPQFQPKAKFTRDNPPRQDKAGFDPLYKQKGYQKIGQQGGYKKPYGQDGRDQKFQRKPYNPDYKREPYNPDYKRENKPYKDYKQRSFDGPRKQPYGGKDNFQKKNDWNKDKDYKPAYQKQAYVQDEGNPKIRQMNRKPSYDQGQRREQSYDPSKRAGNYGQRKDFKQREYKSRQPRQFQIRQDRQYKPRQPREYQPRQPRQDRQYKPREERQNRQYKNTKGGDRDPQAKSFNKENPHLSKWNIENESASRSTGRNLEQPRQFTPQPPRSEPKSQPRILQTEQITFSKPAAEGDDGARRGRTVRRSRGKTPTQGGEE